VVRKVGSPSFKICYDPSNVMNFTDVDVNGEIKEIAEFVAGLCIKDYTPETGGAVNPGEGNVDFDNIFKTLAEAGFSGPAFVETLKRGDARLYDGNVEKSGTLSEVNEAAKKAYKYLIELVDKY
jgi:sugar phosphate isomerase/epimerase